MPEEHILLEKPSTPVPAEELAPQEPDDPFAGPTVNPWRGVRKAAWRLYVFYGGFALPGLAGLVVVWRAPAPLPPAGFLPPRAPAVPRLNPPPPRLPGPHPVASQQHPQSLGPPSVSSL